MHDTADSQRSGIGAKLRRSSRRLLWRWLALGIGLVVLVVLIAGVATLHDPEGRYTWKTQRH